MTDRETMRRLFTDEREANRAEWSYVDIATREQARLKHREEWNRFYCARVVPVMWMVAILLVAYAAWTAK